MMNETFWKVADGLPPLNGNGSLIPGKNAGKSAALPLVKTFDRLTALPRAAVQGPGSSALADVSHALALRDPTILLRLWAENSLSWKSAMADRVASSSGVARWA